MTTTYQIGRGESRTFTITVTSSTGDLVDLTDASIYFIVRGLDGEIALQKLSAAAGGSQDEIEILAQFVDEDDAATKGQFKLKLSTSDTDIEQTARWADCWVVTAADEPETLKIDSHAPFYITGDEPPVFI